MDGQNRAPATAAERHGYMNPRTLPPHAAGCPPPAAWTVFEVPAVLAVLILVGCRLLRPVATTWSINPQYSYGWSVPFLTLLLLVRRWWTRPAPSPPRGGRRWAAWFLAAGCACAILPLRVLEEANPDWRLLGWIAAGIIVSLALLAAFLFGGGPWARHFALPLLFLLVAIPWPERFEEICVQGLMSGVSAVVVGVLDLLGIPAVQRGNLIDVGTSVIGIEDACSGIRSLQATLMVSLFLGQFYDIANRRRVLLVLIGIGFALLTNLARTLFLVLITVWQGQAAFTRWHDTAGVLVLLACLSGVWLFALWMTPPARDAARSPAPPQCAARLPLAAVIGLLVWLLIAEGFTEYWYRRTEFTAGLPATWSVRWPTDAPGYSEAEIPETSRSMLRYSEGRFASWTAPDLAGASGPPDNWSLFFAHWAPGQSAAVSARMHTPRVCLSAAGRKLLGDLGVTPVPFQGLVLPFHTYVFEAGPGHPLFVFYCLWEDRRANEQEASVSLDADLSARGRLQAALAGRRNLGQRVLEVSLYGPSSDSVARSLLATRVPELLQRP